MLLPLFPSRLLRFARNDTKLDCHCEEQSDEAISFSFAGDGAENRETVQ